MTTDAAQTDAAQADLVRWLDHLRALSDIAVGGHTLDEGLQLVAATTRTLLGFDFCGVLTPDPAGRALLITGSSGLSRGYVEGINRTSPVGLGSTAPSSRAFFGGEPVAVEDIALEAGFGPWGGVAGEQGYRSMISVPLRSGAGVLGTLNGYRAETHVYAAAEIEQLTLLANHAAAALISARRVEELRAANAALIDQSEILTRSEEIHERLLRVALQSGGIEGVVQTLADFTGRGVLLESSRHELLASAGEGHERLDALRREQGGEGALVSSVRLSDEDVARLWVSDAAGAGVDPVEERAIDHAEVVIALEIMRERTAFETEQRLRGELLAEVLHDGATESVARRAVGMGHDLARAHLAIVVRLPSVRDQDARRALRAIDAVSAGVQPRPLAALHQGLLVVLWPTGDGEPGTSAAEMVHDALSRALPGAAVLTASSGSHRPTIADSYRVARGALELAAGSGRLSGVVTPEGLGVLGVMLQVDRIETLAAFSDGLLARIRDYDRSRGTELLPTLRMLVGNGMDRSAVAGLLHVHPNTVNQRLRRIESLTGADLTDPGVLLEYASALAVLAVMETRTGG